MRSSIDRSFQKRGAVTDVALLKNVRREVTGYRKGVIVIFLKLLRFESQDGALFADDLSRWSREALKRAMHCWMND